MHLISSTTEHHKSPIGQKVGKTCDYDAVQYDNDQQQFTAQPKKIYGSGWEAAFDGYSVVGLYVA